MVSRLTERSVLYDLNRDQQGSASRPDRRISRFGRSAALVAERDRLAVEAGSKSPTLSACGPVRSRGAAERRLSLPALASGFRPGGRGLLVPGRRAGRYDRVRRIRGSGRACGGVDDLGGGLEGFGCFRRAGLLGRVERVLQLIPSAAQAAEGPQGLAELGPDDFLDRVVAAGGGGAGPAAPGGRRRPAVPRRKRGRRSCRALPP
jgi:hypothetical protein